MAVLFNVAKSKLNQQGQIQRPKYGDGEPVSLSYGKLLEISKDANGGVKTYFLMTSCTGSEFKQPDEILSSQFLKNVSPTDQPYSLKFSLNEDLVSSLSNFIGKSLWFAFTANSVTRLINGNSISYLETSLIAFPDIIGMNGFTPLLEAIFKKESPKT